MKFKCSVYLFFLFSLLAQSSFGLSPRAGEKRPWITDCAQLFAIRDSGKDSARPLAWKFEHHGESLWIAIFEETALIEPAKLVNQFTRHHVTRASIAVQLGNSKILQHQTQRRGTERVNFVQANHTISAGRDDLKFRKNSANLEYKMAYFSIGRDFETYMSMLGNPGQFLEEIVDLYFGEGWSLDNKAEFIKQHASIFGNIDDLTNLEKIPDIVFFHRTYRGGKKEVSAYLVFRKKNLPLEVAELPSLYRHDVEHVHIIK